MTSSLPVAQQWLNDQQHGSLGDSETPWQGANTLPD